MIQLTADEKDAIAQAILLALYAPDSITRLTADELRELGERIACAETVALHVRRASHNRRRLVDYPIRAHRGA